MAKIYPGALGTPVGKHGNTVFRRTNKKTFSYELNQVYNKSVSENVTKNRKNFGVLVKFCNFINKSEIINKIWKKAKVKGYAPNRKILKYNYVTYKAYKISSGIQILPTSLYFHGIKAKMTKNRLTIMFELKDKNLIIDPGYSNFKPPFVFISLVYAKDPVKKDSEINYVNVLLEEFAEDFCPSEDRVNKFTFKTENGFFKFIKDNNTVLVFPAIVSLDEYYQPKKWTECGGIYIKGEHPKIIPYVKTDGIKKPASNILIEYY